MLRTLCMGTALLLASAAVAAPMTETDVAPLLERSDRLEADRDLDAARMPAKAVAFMQLEEGDRVLDLLAGGGYFTELMARAVGPDGFVIAQNPAGLAQQERIRAAEEVRGYGERLPNAAAMDRDFSRLVLAPSSLDAALFHLTYHDLYFEDEALGLPRSEPQQVLAALHRALRPGGTVTVIDHTGAGEDPRAEAEAVHRIDPARVLQDFRQAGFGLVDRQSFFENPADNPARNVFDAEVRGATDRFAMRFAKAGDPNVEFAEENGMADGAEEDIPVAGDVAGTNCDAGAVEQYVGERFAEDLRKRIVEAAGASAARVNEQGDMVTMDYRPDRLNIVLEPGTRNIAELKCG